MEVKQQKQHEVPLTADSTGFDFRTASARAIWNLVGVVPDFTTGIDSISPCRRVRRGKER